MKGRYQVIACLVLLIIIGNAAAAGEISLGVKAGLGISNITETPEEWEDDKSSVTGFTAGFFLNYALSERFSIQPELLYTRRGVGSNLYDGLVLVDLTAKFDYVELPVLAIYSIPVKESFKPFLYAGPSFAATLSSELEVSALLFSAGIDFSSLTHVTDFGIVAGAGFEFLLGDRQLVVDARFHRGFTNVILSGDFEINGSTQTIDEDDFKNYGFAVMAGYVF